MCDCSIEHPDFSINLKGIWEMSIETVSRRVGTLIGFAIAYGIEILGANFFFLFTGFTVAAWAGRTVTEFLDLINALCNALRLRPRLTTDLIR